MTSLKSVFIRCCFHKSFPFHICSHPPLIHGLSDCIVFDMFALGGYYMFIESSSPRAPGDLARLFSPAINGASPMCVQFWYHMYGPHINALNVYLSQGNTLGTPVWTRQGNQRNQWSQGTVQVPGGSASASVTNVRVLVV